MRLDDRIALVTGAGDGIGRGIALAFAREGADVAVCDINSAALEEARAALATTGRKAFARRVDIRDEQQVQSFVNATATEFGRIHVLVNNAAVMPVGPIEELSVETIDQVLSVNLRAPVLFSKY